MCDEGVLTESACSRPRKQTQKFSLATPTTKTCQNRCGSVSGLAAISARHPNQNDQFGVGSFLMLFFFSFCFCLYIAVSLSLPFSSSSLDQIRIRIMLSSRVTTLNSTFEHHYFYLIFFIYFLLASSHSSAPCDFGIAEQKHKTDTQRLFFYCQLLFVKFCTLFRRGSHRNISLYSTAINCI